ncbi:phospholipase D-like domain-containing protein [Nigerium massiliense]|uniref:phospholipase D-like domain-containing protein n=1 Tax=Nigerium massiliense TaxID=1522317 RepID=UPI00058F46E5|nr:phosphatidylserine/phosphatidylglycerophosphate/cardiolipin synthase family protein [Nigerium massiliense]
MASRPRPQSPVTLRSLATLGAVALLGAQLAVIAGLGVIDHGRKKHRRHRPFPTAPPTSVTVADGDVTVYTKGSDLYDAMLDTIRSAEHTIYFETYLWKADDVGQKFKDALTEAAHRGVNVYLAYDVFGNLVVRPDFYRFDPAIHVLRHQPWTGIASPLTWRSPGLNHRKLLIADDKVAYVGGYNIGDLYATRWRDTHARITGSPALDLANVFVDYWNQSRKKHHPVLESPGGREWYTPLRVMRNVPSTGVYPIRYGYLEAFDRATDNIWMTHAYLIPDDDITLALIEAAQRGVDVRIIVPAESNHIVADWLSRGFYDLLLRNGVRLFLYQGAMVHAKTATIDGVWSTIGTANIDRLSLVGNYEVNVEIIDHDLASELEKIFAMDSGNCVELSREEWGGRSVVTKISEAVLVPLRPLL